MWVNKSVNPSQTSTRAAQATPPRMTPGTEQRRATPHTPRCARNSSAATDPKGDLSLPPHAGRGKHLAKPGPQTILGGLAQAPAGLFVASDRTAQTRFCPSGSIPAARSQGIASRTPAAVAPPVAHRLRRSAIQRSQASERARGR